MSIDMWKDLEFDPHGNNPDNDIIGEVHKLTDKTCPWIVVNGAPFVANSVEIKTVTGQPVTTGWKEVYKPMPLTEITGLDINMFIELDNELLEEHDSLVINYHSVGVNFIPRNTLEEQLQIVIHGGTEIPFSKVIQIPATLPSSLHWHAKEEILGWDDLVYLTRYLIGLAESRNNNQSSIDDTYTLVRGVLTTLIQRYNIVNVKLIGHGANRSNPHKITALDLLIGNVDNFAMATLAEDLAGLRSDVFSTPQGALAAIKNVTPDFSGVMKNGTLPFSSLNSIDYLPPIIDGSFEGIGTDNNTSAICLENNGKLMMLRRHFDGRVKQLYYSYVENYRTPNSPIYYTGFAYNNAALSNAGYKPDTIIRGSGQDVLVVGSSAANKWWVTLTNGTLNSETHVFTELNLNSLPGITFAANKSPITVTSTKNYIIFACSLSSGAQNGISFYRIAKSQLGGGVLTPTLFNVSYTDLSGAVKTNTPWYYPDTLHRDSNNRIDRYIHSFPKGITGIVYNYADPVVFVEESTDVLVMRYFLRPYFANTTISPSWNASVSFTISLRINTVTGVITTLEHSPLMSIDSEVGNPVTDASDWMSNIAGGGTVTSLALLPNGDYVTVVPRSFAQTYVMVMLVVLMKQSNPLTSIKYIPTNTVLNSLGAVIVNSLITTIAPTQEGPGSTHPVWDKEGEFVGCFDKDGNKQITSYRKVAGGFAIRASVTNTQLPNLYSRPLTNQVYKTNLGYNCPMAQFTGTAAEVNAAGVDCGVSTMSVFQLRKLNGVWDVILNASTGVLTKVGALFAVPRTFNKTYNNDTMEMTVTPTSYYGIASETLQAVLEMFPTEIAASSHLGFQLIVPYQASVESPLAANLPSFVKVFAYSDTDLSSVVAGVIAVNFTRATQPNTNPAVVLLSAPVLVDSASVYRNAIQNINRVIGPINTGISGVSSFYKDGVTYQIKFCSGFGMTFTGDSGTILYELAWNSSTNKFTSSSPSTTSNGRERVPSVVPKVGFGTIYVGSYDGGAAIIANVNNVSYLLSSVYPETGWILYFKSGTTLTINGTDYKAPVGSVDLRDIDPNPSNKTFYVYVTCYGDQAYYIVSGKRIRHNLSIIPAAKVITTASQILSIERYTTFMIGDAIVSTSRKPGTIPSSIGLPMDEGVLSYVRQVDFPT